MHVVQYAPDGNNIVQMPYIVGWDQGQPTKYSELYYGVRDYIIFYNTNRPHQSLNYKTP
ncbi:MAG: integrase core domain-containing protein [Burkholderiales bacterium]|nr:integrase core domain-containing protein [Burkholderiales bacterium]